MEDIPGTLGKKCTAIYNVVVNNSQINNETFQFNRYFDNSDNKKIDEIKIQQ